MYYYDKPGTIFILRTLELQERLSLLALIHKNTVVLPGFLFV